MKLGSVRNNFINKLSVLLLTLLFASSLASASIFGRRFGGKSSHSTHVKNALSLPEETPILDKKPLTVAPQYSYQTIHQFENTPFKNFDEFCEGVISESNLVTFKEINELNDQIRPILLKLVHENFFKIFKLNLFKECPFWKDSNGFCMHRSCAVDTIDDWKDLPEIWQPEFLGKIESTSNKALDVPNLDADGECIDDSYNSSKDYCEIDEDNEDSVYVNLVDNPERFTGYGGDQSFQIWKSIYNENCFNDQEQQQCIEKNFFYKLISGMHSSISTHLTNDYLNLKTKKYGPNLKQFMFRVGDFPERFENLYLNYILILKSLVKLSNHNVLDNLKFCDKEFESKEVDLKHDLNNLIHSFDNILNKVSNDKGDSVHDFLFDENLFFQDQNAIEIKDEFREKFKNVTRIMDCVHCDRCRLWGKVQTTGYGTALKTLFELDSNNGTATNFQISKFELIALINTFDRLSKSIVSINNFKRLYDEAIFREESVLTDDEFETETDHETAFFGSQHLIEEEAEQNVFMLDDEDNASFSTTEVTAKKDTGKLKPEIEASPKYAFPSEEPTANPEIKYPSKKSGFKLFGDFKFPKMDDFYRELEVVYETFWLVLRSYALLPKLVYNWVLIRLVYYWNKFIGVVVHDFDVDRLYRVDL